MVERRKEVEKGRKTGKEKERKETQEIEKPQDIEPIDPPDLTKAVEWQTYISAELLDDEDEVIGEDEKDEMREFYQRARSYLEKFMWVDEITESYIGLIRVGIVGVFLFKIRPSRPNVDEWIWVIVGDLPSAYITCEDCRNAAQALDGYIVNMSDWVEAAEKGESVADLIPVNVPATKEWAESLKGRLKFLDEKILNQYSEDLED